LFGECLGELRFVVLEPVQRVVHGVLELRLHDRLGQRYLHLVQQGVQRRVADLLRLLDALDLTNLVGQIGSQLIHGVEFTCQLSELVIGLGQFALLHRADGHCHLSFPAGVRPGRQGGGEIAGLARGQADDRVVESFDEAS
jgi:hypothetical protein